MSQESNNMDIEDIILNTYNIFQIIVAILVCILPFYLLYALISLRMSRKGMRDHLKKTEKKVTDEKAEKNETDN